MGKIQTEAQGSSGGILVLWDKRTWNGEMVVDGNQCITGKFTSLNDNWSWHLTGVYDDCNRMTRRILWQELINVRSTCLGPWIVCGDFNVTRYPSERTNCRRLSAGMAEFSNCIEELELVCPTLGEGVRILIVPQELIDSYTAEWGESFSQIKQTILPKLISDHNPILLTCENWEGKKSYFKFGTWWLEVDGFKQKVIEWRVSSNINGRPGYVLVEKLKLLKGKLKEWSRENRENWRQRKEDIWPKYQTGKLCMK